VTTIIGSLGTCAGAWLKVLSVPQDMFWLGFTGQTVVAISQVFILNVPPRLAAVWFGANQVSSACSIGVFGNQVRGYGLYSLSINYIVVAFAIPVTCSFLSIGIYHHR
jgi:hypothetical protein